MANHPTSPGAGEMKTILLISIILAATATASLAAQSSVCAGIDSTISQMKQDLEIQIERIRKARETASSQMTLARLRIAEQLRRSEEDLSTQIESLERFREQMADQKDDTDQAVAQMQNDWKQFSQQAFSDLDSQLRDTNSLITEMENLRDRFDVDPEALNSPSTGQTTLQADLNLQVQAPPEAQPPTDSQTSTPTMAVTPGTSPETVTTTDVHTAPTTPESTTPTATSTTPISTGST
jgi:chromosome segregation ATPase